MKIAYKLIFVLALPIILTWVVALYATSSSEKSLSKAIEQATASQAHSVMEEVDRVMYSRVTDWVAFGQSPEVQEALRLSNLRFELMDNVQQYIDKMDTAWSETSSGSLKELVSGNDLSKAMRIRLKIQEEANGFPVFGEVFITNRYGANIAQTGPTTDYRQDDEEWWKRAQRDGVYVGELSFDESANMFSTDICLRIKDKDGAFAGILKAVLNIKEAVDIVDSQLKGKGEGSDYNYLLLNSEHRVIHSADPAIKFLADGSDYFDNVVPSTHRAVFTAYRDNKEEDGIHRHLLAYAFSSGFSGYKGLGWSLVIEHDAGIVLRPVRALRNNILWMAFAATVAALVFGLAIASSLSRRLRYLSEATIALGQGDLDRTVTLSGSDELTRLAAHFNEMTVELRNATNKLREQASSLEQKNILLERHIAEQKQAEDALRKERDFAESLIDTAQAIVLVLDEHGRIVRFNRYMEELSGYRIEEVRGKDWFGTFLPERDRERIHERFEQVVSGTQTRGKVNQIVAKDGRRYEIEWYDKTLKQSDGSITGVLAIGQDITERASLQSQLAQAQKLEAIGQLAAGIAHEINTPTQFIGDNIRFIREAFADLQTLMARFIQLLEASHSGTPKPELVAEVDATAAEIEVDYLMEEVPKAIDQSLEGVDRVATIVRSMKEFSHPGGKNKELTDLNRAIQSTVTVTRNEWKYVAEMITDFDASLPLVPVLVGDFNQVILNMIINAAQAIQEVVGDSKNGKGKITLITRPDDDWVEVRLSDTGAGMPEEVRKKIFDPFFTTKEVGRGTGQGLAIAHTVVVKKHGGTIDVETEVGRGTTFTIRLPIEPSGE